MKKYCIFDLGSTEKFAVDVAKIGQMFRMEDSNLHSIPQQPGYLKGIYNHPNGSVVSVIDIQHVLDMPSCDKSRMCIGLLGKDAAFVVHEIFEIIEVQESNIQQDLGYIGDCIDGVISGDTLIQIISVDNIILEVQKDK